MCHYKSKMKVRGCKFFLSHFIASYSLSCQEICFHNSMHCCCLYLEHTYWPLFLRCYISVSGLLLFCQILQQSTQLQTLYLGLGGELAALVRQTEVKALAIQLLFRLERASLGEKVRACNTFRQYLSLIKR